VRKPTELTQKICDHCGLALGSGRLIVHDPNGTSGVFHNQECYPNAVKAKEALSLARRLHGDFETLYRVE
jgi:hypothetical protein